MWTINGVDPNTYGLKVSDVPGWETAPGASVVTQQVPAIPGNVALAPTMIAAKKLTVNGHVVGTSNADMLSKLDALKALFAAPALVLIMNNRPSTVDDAAGWRADGDPRRRQYDCAEGARAVYAGGR